MSALDTTGAPRRAVAGGVLEPAVVECAQVMNVNASGYSVDIVTETTMRYYSDLPFGSPYAHHQGGEGMYIMPEVGATCQICWPSDGNHPFVLAYTPLIDQDGTWRGNRRDLSPGDIYMGTRDRNGIIIRRGGVVQVIATPLAQRIYIPINNLIRDMCQNYELHTFGGDLTWLVSRPETNSAGDKTTTFLLQAKEKATDASVLCKLTVGHHDDDQALKLEVYNDGSEDHTVQATLTIDKLGNVDWAVEGGWTLDAKGSVSLSADEDLSLSAGKGATLSGSTGVNIESANGEIVMTSGGDIKLNNAVTVSPDGTTVLGGSGNAHPAVNGDVLLQYLLSHTHPVSGALAASPSSPPPSNLLTTKTFVN